MKRESKPSEQTIFDAESWAKLPSIFHKLPQPVQLTMWGDVNASDGERDGALLCQTLADHFETIRYRALPRRVNYPYYPVIGVMGEEDGEQVDYGVRFIGNPSGYQMTSLITAIQAVSFRGTTLEPVTRIKLHQLANDVSIELITSAEDEGGPLIAKIVFGLAVASSRVRSFLIMSDRFPEANLRYSIKYVPHTVLNGRVHVEGVVDEAVMMKHLALAVQGSH